MNAVQAHNVEDSRLVFSDFFKYDLPDFKEWAGWYHDKKGTFGCLTWWLETNKVVDFLTIGLCE